MAIMMKVMTYLAFIEGLGEKGFMPLKDARRVRKLIQLLDVIVLDIGPDQDGDDDDNDGDDGLPAHSHHGGNFSWCCLMMVMGIQLFHHRCLNLTSKFRMFRMMMVN